MQFSTPPISLEVQNLPAQVIPFPPLLHHTKDRIHCPKGLIGFEEYQQFHLYDYSHSSYSFLSSIDNPHIRFLLYGLSWDFYPIKDLVEGLIYEQIDAIDDIIYGIVSLDNASPTLNLRAPLVRKDDILWQIVLNEFYDLDYPLDSL